MACACLFPLLASPNFILRLHTIPLCRDELALAEEERQFSSERAVHHKVPLPLV
jgi:hypothetical protein